MVPTETRPLWAIRIDPDRAGSHAPYELHRRTDPATRERFFNLLLRCSH